MASKSIKFILIFFLTIILFECSLDNKTGIWTDKKKKETNSALIKLSDNKEKFQKELNSKVAIKFNTQAERNNTWLMSGLNNSNLIHHLKFNWRSKKFNKYKIKKIKNSIVKESPLIIGENYFIITGEEGHIFKLNKGKKIRWSRNIYNKKEKKRIENISLVLSGDTLYAADNLGKYYSLNSNTGKIIWINQHDAIFNSQIKVFKDKIFVVDNDNKINCFSATDGKQLWKFVTNSTFIKTNKKLSIIINQNSVVFSNSAGDIAKIDINTGKLIWFMPTQNTLVEHMTDFLENSDIVLYKKNIFFSNNFSRLYSLSTKTGTINWKININSSVRPIVIDNFLFTISEEGYLIVADAIGGKIIRSKYLFSKFKKKIRAKIDVQGFLIASNKIYITTNLGYLIICSVNTGKVEKVLKIGNFQLSKPFVSNSKLYVLAKKSLLEFN